MAQNADARSDRVFICPPGCAFMATTIRSLSQFACSYARLVNYWPAAGLVDGHVLVC